MNPETQDKTTPQVTIVIPIYNEEGILQSSIAGLTEALEDFPWTYHILLSENGSRDGTREVASKLIAKHPEVSIIHSDEPNYGKALRRGILKSKSPIIICDEIDLCDVDFYHRAIAKIEQGADLVVGSKTLDRSLDKRPAFRKLATQVINFLLRVFLDFQGTDTHGLKAFKRERLLDVVNKCVVDRDLFASEFVIRSGRLSFNVVEIPVEVIEKRAPSIALTRRVPNVLKGIAKLVWAIRVQNR